MKTFAAFLTLLIILLPLETSARHTSYYRIDRSDLDDDIVEDVPVPLLFAVTHEELDDNFGELRGGGTRLHEGLDILAPKGTPIVSPTEAIVIRTGEGPSAGNYVYTANPGGETFRYMHLDEIADIKPGDELDVGDFIGTVGDTGNAPDGVYHLHLEIRDEDNDPLDPYDRLTETFTINKQISYLKSVINDYDGDEDAYAEYLVATFPEVFQIALEKRYRMPDEIDDALEDTDTGTIIELQNQLDNLIDSIPKLLSTPLSLGDQNGEVVLLQFYLIYKGDGPAHDNLLKAGATGYFGSITEAALKEYQEAQTLIKTGMFDNQTKNKLD